jgi:thiamine biosynthesis lipoprotein
MGSPSKKKRPLKKLKLALILVAVFVAALLAVRFYNLYRFHLEQQTRFMMDTYVTIYAVGPKKITAPAVNLALDRMQEVDAKFNRNNPKSPVYDFNHQGVPITDREILDVARVALEVTRESDGAFDITIAPLIELWGFYGDSPHLPKEEEIRDCLMKTGSRYLSLKDSKLEKTKESIQIDLGGIAKGHAVRKAGKVLRAAGVTSALIDAGGDVYALGKRGRDLWKVGIRNPRGDDLLGYLEVEDLAVMGSGDYERFFVQAGKRYHHIFDPKTGHPAEGLRSTTLIHPDPTLADAWNTAIFVLGPEKGLDLVERIPGMEAILVTVSGEVMYSSGLRNALVALSQSE